MCTLLTPGLRDQSKLLDNSNIALGEGNSYLHLCHNYRARALHSYESFCFQSNKQTAETLYVPIRLCAQPSLTITDDLRLSAGMLTLEERAAYTPAPSAHDSARPIPVQTRASPRLWSRFLYSWFLRFVFPASLVRIHVGCFAPVFYCERIRSLVLVLRGHQGKAAGNEDARGM